MKKYKGGSSAGDAGQQAFTSTADRSMSKRHLADRIKIDKEQVAMDKRHMADHKKLAAQQKSQLKKVQHGK